MANKILSLPKEFTPGFSTTKKPTIPVEIDLSNILAKNLIESFQFSGRKKPMIYMPVVGDAELKDDCLELSNTYLEVPDVGTLDRLDGLSKFSVAVDLYLSGTSGDGSIISKIDSTFMGWAIFFDKSGPNGSQVFEFFVQTVSNNPERASPSVSHGAGRYKLVATFDGARSIGDRCQVYVNSINESSPSGAGSPTNHISATTNPISIGRHSNVSDRRYFEGKIYSINLYNDVLNPAQIDAFTENPYQILKPQIDTFYFPAADGIVQDTVYPVILPKEFTPGFSTTKKPTIPVEIDWSHGSLAKMTDSASTISNSGIVHFIDGDTSLQRKNNERYKPSSSTVKLERSAANFNLLSSLLRWNTAEEQVEFLHGATARQTIIVNATLIGYGGGGFGRVFEDDEDSSGAAGAAFFIRSSPPYLRASINSVSLDFTAFTPIFNERYTFVYVKNSDTQCRLSVYSQTGTLIESKTATTSTDAVGTIYFGNRPELDRGFDGDFHYIISDNRAWTDFELDLFASSPDSILKPQIDTFYFPAAAGGGDQFISIGLAATLDSTNTLSRQKSKAINTSTEVSTAQNMQSAATASINLSNETNAAFNLQRAKQKLISSSTEADSATVHIIEKVRNISLPGTINTATLLNKAKALSIIIANETDIAYDISSSARVQIGLTSESDTATNVNKLKLLSIVSVDEINSAQVMSSIVGTELGQSTEVDTATSHSSTKEVAIVQVSEVNSTMTVHRLKTASTGTALSIASAFGNTWVKAYSVVQATELGSALPVSLQQQQVITVGVAIESDSTFTLVVFGSGTLNNTDIAAISQAVYDKFVSEGFAETIAEAVMSYTR